MEEDESGVGSGDEEDFDEDELEKAKQLRQRLEERINKGSK